MWETSPKDRSPLFARDKRSFGGRLQCSFARDIQLFLRALDLKWRHAHTATSFARLLQKTARHWIDYTQYLQSWLLRMSTHRNIQTHSTFARLLQITARHSIDYTQHLQSWLLRRVTRRNIRTHSTFARLLRMTARHSIDYTQHLQSWLLKRDTRRNIIPFNRLHATSTELTFEKGYPPQYSNALRICEITVLFCERYTALFKGTWLEMTFEKGYPLQYLNALRF